MLRAVCATPIVGSVPQPTRFPRMTETGIEYDKRFALLDPEKMVLLRRRQLGSLAVTVARVDYEWIGSGRVPILKVHGFDPKQAVSIAIEGIDSSDKKIEVEDPEARYSTVTDCSDRFVGDIHQNLSEIFGRAVSIVYLPERDPPFINVSILPMVEPQPFPHTGVSMRGTVLPSDTNFIVTGPDDGNLDVVPIAGWMRFATHSGLKPKAPFARLVRLRQGDDGAYSQEFIHDGTIQGRSQTVMTPIDLQ